MRRRPIRTALAPRVRSRRPAPPTTSPPRSANRFTSVTHIRAAPAHPHRRTNPARPRRPTPPVHPAHPPLRTCVRVCRAVRASATTAFVHEFSGLDPTERVGYPTHSPVKTRSTRTRLTVSNHHVESRHRRRSCRGRTAQTTRRRGHARRLLDPRRRPPRSAVGVDEHEEQVGLARHLAVDRGSAVALAGPGRHAAELDLERRACRPGTTWRRKRTPSTPPNSGSLPACVPPASTAYAPSWAMASTISTPGKRGPTREVAGEERLVAGERPRARRRPRPARARHLVDEQERRPVRQDVSSAPAAAASFASRGPAAA